MKLIIRRLLTTDQEIEEDDKLYDELIMENSDLEEEENRSGLEELCSYFLLKDDHFEEFEDGYSDTYAVLNFDEEKIREFISESDYLEMALPEEKFALFITVLNLIFSDIDKCRKEESFMEKEERKEEDGDLEDQDEDTKYKIGWHNVNYLPVDGSGLTLFEIGDMAEIDPSVAVSFFWPPKPNKTEN